jgi:hypothetical protein
MSGTRWELCTRPSTITGLTRIPALGTASSLAWGAGTAAAVVATTIWSFATQPEYRPATLVSFPVFALLTIWLLWASNWVDPLAGSLVEVRCGRLVRRYPLGAGTSVVLVPNFIAGAVLLGARPPGWRRRVHVMLLVKSIYVENSMSPDLLRLLADTLDRHGTQGADEVGPLLRAQADHLDAGGGPADSPLAALLGDLGGSR